MTCFYSVDEFCIETVGLTKFIDGICCGAKPIRKSCSGAISCLTSCREVKSCWKLFCGVQSCSKYCREGISCQKFCCKAKSILPDRLGILSRVKFLLQGSSNFRCSFFKQFQIFRINHCGILTFGRLSCQIIGKLGSCNSTCETIELRLDEQVVMRYLPNADAWIIH